MTSSASTSSDTFIVPSSAVNADPLRPITITAISTGPSSRRSDTATRSGTNVSPPSLRSSVADCIARVNPTLNAVSATIGSARAATIAS